MKRLICYLLIGSLVLSGCESSTDSEHAGIEGTGEQVTLASAYGTVSGFGSIYVNGIHFDTDLAAVQIAGEPATEDDLAVGMVVEVVGEVGDDGKTGVAQTIHAQRVLVGVAESVIEVGRGRKAIQVLGQTVYVNEDSAFVGTSFDDLAAGNGINVSGFVTDNGLINATYIAKQEIGDGPREIEGYVSAVDIEAQSFALKDLTVLFAAAEFINGDQVSLVVGKRVRVVGVPTETGQTLLANTVEFNSRPIQDARYTSLEGVVRDLIAGVSFTLHGTLVDLRDAEIENGVAADIRDGTQVVVFGALVQGQLQAERIRIKPLNTVRFQGLVAEIDAANQTFRLGDSLFAATRFTQFKDESRFGERYFNFDSLRAGEDVEVFAVEDGDIWQVTRIIRRDENMGPPNIVRGQVSQVDEGRSFYIDDLFIDGSEVPEHEWMTLRERPEGDEDVEVQGYYTGEGQFRATHVHVHPNPPCDPHVFFECDHDRPPVMPPPDDMPPPTDMPIPLDISPPVKKPPFAPAV